MKFQITILKVLAACLIAFTGLQLNKANAQSSDFKDYGYIQPNIGVYQYFGDLNADDYFNKTISLGYGGVLGWQINRILGIRGQFNMGDLKSERKDFNGQNINMLTSLMTGSGQLTFNINEIFNRNPNRCVNLYLMAGAGYIDTKSTLSNMDTKKDIPGMIDTKKNGIYYPVGGGIHFRLSEMVGLNLEYNHGLMFNDDILDNSINKGDKSKNDQYSYTSLGLQISFKKAKDSDGDGVPDKEDICPEVAGLKEFQGCPDSDSDGIPDKDDQCPKMAGLKEFHGCPDSDGDGIPDKEDNCPNVAGKKELKGCPDADGDGIPDHLDKCPNVFGVAQFDGCPDTDGDGIPDSKDECPDVKGIAQFNGCPDTDGDGIPDHLDKCPTVAGVKENKGCPPVKEETVKVFTEALQGIQFDVNKATIKPSSHIVLDKVVNIMRDNPEYDLEVNGHTDSQGPDDYNQVLSDKRAASVKDYLVEKGIAEKRMTSKGFGESQPVADNKTKEGRYKNRRVEFKVIF